LSAKSLLETAFHDGVEVELSAAGRIRAKGPSEALNKWLPELRAKRAEIEAALRPIDWLGDLLSRPRPEGEPLARWQARCAGVRRFVTDGWHRQAAALGWSHEALYGRDDAGVYGAVWHIEGDRLLFVTANQIMACSKTGLARPIYRGVDYSRAEAAR
jgi:hypothetical protein